MCPHWCCEVWVPSLLYWNCLRCSFEHSFYQPSVVTGAGGKVHSLRGGVAAAAGAGADTCHGAPAGPRAAPQ